MKLHPRQCSHLCPHGFAPWPQHRAFCSPAPASPVCADKPTDTPTRPSPCPPPSSAETYLASSPPPREAFVGPLCAHAHTSPRLGTHAQQAHPGGRVVPLPSVGGALPGTGRHSRRLPRVAYTHVLDTAAAAHGGYQHLMPVPSSRRGTPGAESSREQHEGSQATCPGRVRTRLTALGASGPGSRPWARGHHSSVCLPSRRQLCV